MAEKKEKPKKINDYKNDVTQQIGRVLPSKGRFISYASAGGIEDIGGASGKTVLCEKGPEGTIKIIEKN